MTFTDRERAKTTPELLQEIQDDIDYFKDRIKDLPKEIPSGKKYPNGRDIMIPNPLYLQRQLMIRTNELELNRRMSDHLKLYY